MSINVDVWRSARPVLVPLDVVLKELDLPVEAEHLGVNLLGRLLLLPVAHPDAKCLVEYLHMYILLSNIINFKHSYNKTK